MKVGDTIYCEDGHKHIITKVEEHDLWSIRSGTKIWFKRENKGFLDTKECWISKIEAMSATAYYENREEK